MQIIGNLNKVFRALNDQTRRDILDLLREKDLTAGEIAGCFSFTKPTISHHLDLLKQAGLVLGVKKGQFIYYSINTTVLEEIMTWIIHFGNKPKK